MQPNSTHALCGTLSIDGPAPCSLLCVISSPPTLHVPPISPLVNVGHRDNFCLQFVLRFVRNVVAHLTTDPYLFRARYDSPLPVAVTLTSEDVHIVPALVSSTRQQLQSRLKYCLIHVQRRYVACRSPRGTFAEFSLTSTPVSGVDEGGIALSISIGPFVRD